MTKLKGGKRPALESARAVLFAVITGLSGATFAQAAGQPERVRAEAAALVDSLGSSGCEFQRNGSWYSADEARAHLSRKLKYMMERQPPVSTEQFVEMAASRSSLSGKAYVVRCPAKDAVPSRDWLLARLAHLRSTTHTAPKQ